MLRPVNSDACVPVGALFQRKVGSRWRKGYSCDGMVQKCVGAWQMWKMMMDATMHLYINAEEIERRRKRKTIKLQGSSRRYVAAKGLRNPDGPIDKNSVTLEERLAYYVKRRVLKFRLLIAICSIYWKQRWPGPSWSCWQYMKCKGMSAAIRVLGFWIWEVSCLSALNIGFHGFGGQLNAPFLDKQEFNMSFTWQLWFRCSPLWGFEGARAPINGNMVWFNVQVQFKTVLPMYIIVEWRAEQQYVSFTTAGGFGNDFISTPLIQKTFGMRN